MPSADWRTVTTATGVVTSMVAMALPAFCGRVNAAARAAQAQKTLTGSS